MALVGAGDREALREVYGLTNAKLFGIVRRVLSDEGEAEEVLQETYITVWKRADRFDASRASPITWLATIARNKAIDRLRAGRSARKSDPLDDAPEIVDTGAAPGDALDEAQRLERLNLCLDGLEPENATIVREAFFGDHTYLQLSERDGVPLGTVKSRIRRSLLRLRDCLGTDI
ncbi:MAG: sigma-70 family RNA polymerase sigma factor [Pseudomonadota bacterium]